VKSSLFYHIFTPNISGSHALNRFWFELVMWRKKQIENMLLQISVTAGSAHFITPWHEVKYFKTIFNPSLLALIG
jgi:hypothetical protein